SRLTVPSSRNSSVRKSSRLSAGPAAFVNFSSPSRRAGSPLLLGSSTLARTGLDRHLPHRGGTIQAATCITRPDSLAALRHGLDPALGRSPVARQRSLLPSFQPCVRQWLTGSCPAAATSAFAAR